jgi:uncharacterized protein
MKYYYLHGFASGAKSFKALYFKDKLKTDFKINLNIPDLNQPSFEKLTLSSQLAYLKDLLKQDEEIFLIGSSLGAYLSILLNEDKEIPIKAMFLMAPAFEFLSRQLAKMSDSDLKKWQETDEHTVYHHGLKQNKNLSYAIIQDANQYEKSDYQINCETTVFHGYNDESVPWELSKKYLEAKEGVTIKFVNSDHQLKSVLGLMYQSLHQFIESTQ